MAGLPVEGKDGCRTLEKPGASFFFDLNLVKVSHVHTGAQTPANVIFPPTGWEE